MDADSRQKEITISFPLHSTAPDIAVQKKRLRQQALARRQAMPTAAQHVASEAVARHFADHPILSFCQSVAGYHAIRAELNVLPVLEVVTRLDRPTALPRIVAADKTLTFHRWQAGDTLEYDPLGIKVPPADAEAFVPELVLVPLVAFDSEGGRLGYGGGYYDRTITKLRNESGQPPLFIGVAYNLQEVEYIPTEPQDEPLDGILTDLGVSMFGGFGL